MKKTTVSIVQGNSRIGGSSFRAQDYERGGVSSDEIQEIKEAFDLFDTGRTGLIRPSGNPPLTQNCRPHWHRSAPSPPTSPSSRSLLTWSRKAAAKSTSTNSWT